MTEFFIYQAIVMAIPLITILANRDLMRRDSFESKKIFDLAVMTIISAFLEVAATIYTRFFYADPGDFWYYLVVFPLVVFNCLKEILLLQVVMGWNLYVDYTIYRSFDHVKDKHKKALIPCIILALGFVAFYMPVGKYFSDGRQLYVVMMTFKYICYAMQLLFVANAIYIVVKSKMGRKPPSFLRMDAFLIPAVTGYVVSHIPVINVYDYRDLGLAVAVCLTWFTVKRKNRYVDLRTGFFNKNFLADMNDYMEKSGYPNGTGIYIKSQKNGDKMKDVIGSFKPADAEVFSLGENEFLIMAGPQKESVIRLLIKSIKLKAASEDSTIAVSSAYAVRQEGESSEAFTKRLVAFSK